MILLIPFAILVTIGVLWCRGISSVPKDLDSDNCGWMDWDLKRGKI